MDRERNTPEKALGGLGRRRCVTRAPKADINAAIILAPISRPNHFEDNMHIIADHNDEGDVS